MSHVALQKTKAGEPVFVDIEALRIAAERIGLVMEKRSNYAWWGQSVGDYPLPAGWTAADIGNNATYVLSLPKEKAAKFASWGRGPFEIGIIADPENPGCWSPCYDFFNGGYGLDELVGAPVYNDKGELEVLAPLLIQRYQMVADEMAAAEAGDNITFMSTKEAHMRYPDVFTKEGNDRDFVSVVDTGERVGDHSLAFDQVRA